MFIFKDLVNAAGLGTKTVLVSSSPLKPGVDRRRRVLCHLRLVLLVRRLRCRLFGHPVRDDRDEGADKDMPAGIPSELLLTSMIWIYLLDFGKLRGSVRWIRQMKLECMVYTRGSGTYRVRHVQCDIYCSSEPSNVFIKLAPNNCIAPCHDRMRPARGRPLARLTAALGHAWSDATVMTQLPAKSWMRQS